SLFAKAIAIKVNHKLQIFISGDLLMMPPKVVEHVIKDLATQKNIQRHQILFGATHTHSSLGNFLDGFIGQQFTGEFQEEVVSWLSKKITTVIIDAIDDLQAAEMATTYVKATPYIANRIIGKTGRLNDKLTLVSINQENGRKAIIGIFAAHPTIISSWNSEFSGDYPAAFQRNLEQNGIDLAMFFGGTLGSHTNKGPGDKFERTEYVGKALADSCLIAIASLEYKNQVQLSRINTQIELPKLQIIPITSKIRLAPWLGHRLLGPIENVYLQSLSINDLIWISLPCELSGEYAIDLKNALELSAYKSAFTSFNGQYLGYVVPAKYYYYDTYESRLMGWYGPSFGDYLMELNFTMANILL
ncbi:MAG: neutral/alkaline non-lysosomal ceramidase N-terminal domain-containing protein, partial [Bacteroidales bacterium]|nr:neutral/alkaline non-lysosomal ceramidase N-terminal domain-containing protein [Bacteroidales bacterium]